MDSDLKNSRVSERPNYKTKLGILMPTWVGDACMATPAVRALRSTFPDACITGIMRPVLTDLFEGLADDDGRSFFDETITFSKRLVDRYRLVNTIRRQKMDTVVLLPNSLWSAAAMRYAEVKRIVGYNRDWRGWLLTDPVPVSANEDKSPIPPIDYYLRLAEWLGCEPQSRTMQLTVSEKDEQAANQLWETLKFSATTPTLVINSSSATDLGRVWAADRVLELSKRVAEEFDWQVLLHCGPAERDTANTTARRAKDPRIASMGAATSLPISLSKAVLKRAAAVVTSDSGPRHIAVALDRPVITLYGTTCPEGTLTYNVPETAVVAPGAQANSGIRNMQSIQVDHVFEKVREAIAKQNAA